MIHQHDSNCGECGELVDRVRALESDLSTQHNIAQNLAHNEELETRRANRAETRAEKAEARLAAAERLLREHELTHLRLSDEAWADRARTFLSDDPAWRDSGSGFTDTDRRIRRHDR